MKCTAHLPMVDRSLGEVRIRGASKEYRHGHGPPDQDSARDDKAAHRTVAARLLGDCGPRPTRVVLKRRSDQGAGITDLACATLAQINGAGELPLA